MNKLVMSLFALAIAALTTASVSYAMPPLPPQKMMCKYFDVKTGKPQGPYRTDFTTSTFHLKEDGTRENVWLAQLDKDVVSSGKTYPIHAEAFLPQVAGAKPYINILWIKDDQGNMAQANYGFGKNTTDSLQTRLSTPKAHVTLDCITE